MATGGDATGWLLLGGVTGAGLLSGLYFIFSFCVMQALDEQPPASAIATMNAINIDIVNAPFVLVFMGTPIVCAFLLARTLKEGIRASLDNTYTAAGAMTLVVFEFLLTLIVHVPKNDALAAYSPGSGNDASIWSSYYKTWTPWNHVRMAASVATVVLLSMAHHQRSARLALSQLQTQLQ